MIERYEIQDVKTPDEVGVKLAEQGYQKGDTLLIQHWRGSETIKDGFKISEQIGRMAGMPYGETKECVILQYPFEVYKGTHCATVKSINPKYYYVLYEFFGFKQDSQGRLVWLMKRRQ